MWDRERCGCFRVWVQLLSEVRCGGGHIAKIQRCYAFPHHTSAHLFVQLSQCPQPHLWDIGTLQFLVLEIAMPQHTEGSHLRPKHSRQPQSPQDPTSTNVLLTILQFECWLRSPNDEILHKIFGFFNATLEMQHCRWHAWSACT